MKLEDRLSAPSDNDESNTTAHKLVKRGNTSSNCGDIWIDGDAFLAVATAGLVFAAFLLNQAITMAGRKRRRRGLGGSNNYSLGEWMQIG